MSLPRRKLADAIRALAMDAVQKANSGHPGMPMGMADIAQVLWCDFLKHNPRNPHWSNRDRFVMSNGHGAMLLYALLHLTGYELSIEDLRQFRQLHSKTPGHPEYGETPGVETTTGPLGQGLANGVGMALAERILAAHFNRENFNIVDHFTYVFAGDGCLMEGISHEACSLAGTWGLGKLIVFYDDNGISIDGEVEGWFTDDTPKRFAAYHWHVIEDVDGHNADAVRAAIIAAQAETQRPSIICCKTTIGFGAPNLAGSEKTHGAPLGEKEIESTRQNLNWSYPPFVIPEEIYQAWNAQKLGETTENTWRQLFAKYQSQYPELAKEFLRREQNELPKDWKKHCENFLKTAQQQKNAMATRKASQQCLEAFAPLLPELIGGSADLTVSNLTNWSGMKVFNKQQPDANYIEYGVREFGMSAMMNGIALHHGFIPYGGTFLVFTDYARNAVRLSALMQQRVIFVYTHDSVGLGEDGPTHQPIEHAAMLRMTPGMNVWRPCDLVETAVAWRTAIEHRGPSCLLLSRQSVAAQTRSENLLPEIAKGGYILLEAEGEMDGIIIATGSEVDLAITAAKELRAQGIQIRVVSMPCCEIFKQQSLEYRHKILPPKVDAILAIEAAAKDYWYQFVGRHGDVLGLARFGLSAPDKAIFAELGFTVENVKNRMLTLLKLKVES